MLQTYAIMERGEVHYLLNKLFLEDYCVWIQKVGGRATFVADLPVGSENPDESTSDCMNVCQFDISCKLRVPGHPSRG